MSYPIPVKGLRHGVEWLFLKRLLDKIDVKEQIKSCPNLPVQNSNRGHSIPILIESFITSIWCRAHRFLHTEITRGDEALSKISDWNIVPRNNAYKRFFNKFSQATNQNVGHHFFSWFFKNLNIDYFTLDIDYYNLRDMVAKMVLKRGTILIRKGEIVIIHS